MGHSREVRQFNEYLGAELGRNSRDGGPLYKWIWSEDNALLHAMRVPGEYNYKARESDGLIIAGPVYKMRKMCLTAEKQWVLCHWIDSPGYGEWIKLFGTSMEWPKGGQYYPTNVTLDPGERPSLALTQAVAGMIREMRGKTGEQVVRETEDSQGKREATTKQNLYEQIRDACTTYDHVPGNCDQVSYPTTQKDQ